MGALLVVALRANLACGTACQNGDSRCDGDNYEICNTDRSGWSPSSCHLSAYPSARCVTLDDHTAVCSITGQPLPLCAGGRATACAAGAVVHCYQGHGAPLWTPCEPKQCIDGASESTCADTTDGGGGGGDASRD